MKKSSYQPPHTITPEILNRVAAIGEAIGRLTVLDVRSSSGFYGDLPVDVSID